VKEQLVHVPEPVLEGGSLGCGSRGQGVRVDPGQREMLESEPDPFPQFPPGAFNRLGRLPRVRAFVVAVLDDKTTRGRAAGMINGLINRLQGRLRLLPCRVARREVLLVRAGRQRFRAGWAAQNPVGWRMRTMWMRPGSSWRISRIFPT
jgi:hypothetical protein